MIGKQLKGTIKQKDMLLTYMRPHRFPVFTTFFLLLEGPCQIIRVGKVKGILL